MGVIFKIVLLCTFIALAGCDKGYIKKDGKWCYKDWDEGAGVFCEELKGVDNPTFTERSDGLGADKNSMWAGARPLDADPLTFIHIGGAFYRDKNAVFWRQHDSIAKVKDADVNTFHVLQGGYAADALQVYYQTDKIDKVNVGTFSPTSEYYATDKYNVWYRGLLISKPRVFPKKIIRAVDRKSFKDLGDGDAQDQYGKIGEC